MDATQDDEGDEMSGGFGQNSQIQGNGFGQKSFQNPWSALQQRPNSGVAGTFQGAGPGTRQVEGPYPPGLDPFAPPPSSAPPWWTQLTGRPAGGVPGGAYNGPGTRQNEGPYPPGIDPFAPSTGGQQFMPPSMPRNMMPPNDMRVAPPAPPQTGGPQSMNGMPVDMRSGFSPMQKPALMGPNDKVGLRPNTGFRPLTPMDQFTPGSHAAGGIVDQYGIPRFDSSGAGPSIGGVPGYDLMSRGDGFTGARGNSNFVNGNIFGAAPFSGDPAFANWLARFGPSITGR